MLLSKTSRITKTFCPDAKSLFCEIWRGTSLGSSIRSIRAPYSRMIAQSRLIIVIEDDGVVADGRKRLSFLSLSMSECVQSLIRGRP